ncbi:MAG: site-2 protease family protein [Alphaproteobacteria bacterium]
MNSQSLSHILVLISVWAIPGVVAITLHEAAHGYVAWKLGDDTAYRLGRVSFNPLRHIDPFGTILLPLMLLMSGTRFMFGWAKPVPVNFGRLNHPRRDMVLVAAAGPGINLALAIISALLIHVAVLFPDVAREWAVKNLGNSILFNVVLAVFNMFPLPPLDGGRVAVGLLPRELARPLAKLERWGLFILVGLLFILPLVFKFSVFSWLIGVPADFLIRMVCSVTGLGSACQSIF